MEFLILNGEKISLSDLFDIKISPLYGHASPNFNNSLFGIENRNEVKKQY